MGEGPGAPQLTGSHSARSSLFPVTLGVPEEGGERGHLTGPSGGKGEQGWGLLSLHEL